MDAFLPGWSPELERAFKEVLFRFLEHVHCTKAALYLLSPDGSYQLATQYGFGRRDLLTVRFEAATPIIQKARDLRVKPFAVNHRDEFPGFADELSGAGSTRMLLVPIYGGSRLAGFVDARDKGKKRPFEAGDLATASGIARDMLALVRTTGIVDGVEDDEPPPTAAHEKAEVAAGGKAASSAVPVMDEIGLERLVRNVPTLLDAESDLTALAVTVVGDDQVAARVITAGDLDEDGCAPVLFHQAEALRKCEVATPPPAEWRVRLVPRPCRRGGTGPSYPTQAIASDVVLQTAGWALVISVVGGTEQGRLERALARLEREVREISDEVQLRYTRRHLTENLLKTRDGRYRTLERHSLTVARYAWMTAMEMGLGAYRAEQAAAAGLLHDIGMRELDFEALYRHPSPGPSERRAYRRHPEVGEDLAHAIGLGELARAIRHHHERWDGKGYPDGLQGEAIPVLSRIVHAAEVFDALTSSDSYRNAVTEERATAILKAESGKQFDPSVVTALLRVV